MDPQTQSSAAAPAPAPVQSPRERFLQRLQSESGSAPEPVRPVRQDRTERAPREAQEAGPVEDDEVARGSRESDIEQDSPDDADLDPDLDEGEEDYGDLTPREIEMRQEIDRLQEREKELTRDYTRKTQRIAEARRVVEGAYEEVSHVANFYAHLSQQTLQPFQNVDWNALKAQPERYQAASQSYQQALRQAEELESARTQVVERHKAHVEKVKSEEAALAKEILKTQIPNWGNDHYSALREFAASELSITPQEFNDLTSWQWVMAIHRLWEVSRAPRVGKPRREQRQAKPQAGRTAPVQTRRSPEGRYESARQRAFSAPGDRASFREMKAAQLRKERDNRR